MIRCIFDANTGCLIEYNTQREPEADEFVAYTTYLKLPENGLIYDFSTNTVREATAEEAAFCQQLLEGDTTQISGRVIVYTLTLQDVQYIRHYTWTKLMWTGELADSSHTIQLTPGTWAFVGQVTPVGFSCIRQFHLRCLVNGELIFERFNGGVYFQKYGVSFMIQNMFSTTTNVQFEMLIYCNKYITIDSTDTRTFLKFWKHE